MSVPLIWGLLLCFTVCTQLSVCILFSLIACQVLCYQDDEEDAIHEELSKVEARVRKCVDVKMNYNKQQNVSGMLFKNNEELHKQVYSIWYEDERVLSSQTDIALPTTSQL